MPKSQKLSHPSIFGHCADRTHAFKLTMQTENVDNKHFSSCARVVLSVAFSAPIPISVLLVAVAVVRVVVAVGRPALNKYTAVHTHTQRVCCRVEGPLGPRFV